VGGLNKKPKEIIVTLTVLMGRVFEN